MGFSMVLPHLRSHTSGGANSFEQRGLEVSASVLLNIVLAH